MIEEVYSLAEAQEWFLSHCEGLVRCVYEQDEANTFRRDCRSFPEAKAFYESFTQ